MRSDRVEPHQAFLPVGPIGALDVDRPAVDAQTAVQHPVAVAAALASELCQSLAQPLVAVITGAGSTACRV